LVDYIPLAFHKLAPFVRLDRVNKYYGDLFVNSSQFPISDCQQTSSGEASLEELPREANVWMVDGSLLAASDESIV